MIASTKQLAAYGAGAAIVLGSLFGASAVLAAPEPVMSEDPGSTTPAAIDPAGTDIPASPTEEPVAAVEPAPTTEGAGEHDEPEDEAYDDEAHDDEEDGHDDEAYEEDEACDESDDDEDDDEDQEEDQEEDEDPEYDANRG